MIAGPTGIGKTDLAVEIAKRVGGELISCDSVQVYRDLSIGANKTPTSVPQHLIDIADWRSPFTAADFLNICRGCISDIVERDKVPILVGGTGFYLDWIIEGRPGAPPSDPVMMKMVEEEIKGLEWDKAHKILQKVDSEYAAKLMKNDYYRLKRALVVHRTTGKSLSSFKSRSDKADIDWRCFYLSHSNRETLLRHIDRRCEAMIQNGLIQEVIGLAERGFSVNCQAGRSIGYKETLELLDALRKSKEEGEADRLVVEYIKEFQSQTRQYTRKQEKWFSGKERFLWIERPSLSGNIEAATIDQIISLYKLEGLDPDNELVRKSKEFQSVCRSGESMRRRKGQLRTFQSHLVVFGSEDMRRKLLEQLKLQQ